MAYEDLITQEAIDRLQCISFQSIQIDQLRIYIHGLKYDNYTSTSPSMPHKHDFFEFHYILSGQILTGINGIERRYRGGEYYLMPPYVTHYHAHERGDLVGHRAFTLRWKVETTACDHPNLEMNRMKYLLDNAVPTPILDTGHEIAHIMGDMIELSRTGASTTELKMKFAQVLFLLSRRYAQESSLQDVSVSAPDNVQDILNRALAYMGEHYGEQLSASDIAKHSHVSYGYLARLFTRYMNTTILDYVMKMRIDRAQRLLLTSDVSVGEISEQLGFANISHLSNTFKEITGLSPLRFRAMYKSRGNASDPTML